MDDFLKAVNEYWPMVVAAMPLVFKVLNKYTPKWYDQADKAKRFVLQVIDLLDLYKVEAPPKEEEK